MTLTRTLELDGVAAVAVHLAMPVPGDDHWSCDYRILGLSRPIARHAMGIDPIQVLTLALCMIRADFA